MEKEIDPRMHTAEHVLNQTMVRMFGCGRCFSAHIEKKKSKCDYRFDRPLRDEELREIEKTVNNVIAGDFPVTEEYLTREEAASRFVLDRLPQDAGDKIRIIKVGDYDACPCVGPHVRSTGQLGAFRMISSSYENSVLRIRYKLS
jgi:misacylated tRNA(Ala) deacylase